jgi:hypothetical protein
MKDPEKINKNNMLEFRKQSVSDKKRSEITTGLYNSNLK